MDGEVLKHLLDRPIAFHRCLVSVAGSVTAGLMLSQAIYWSRITSDPDGRFWKTRDEWEEETGLSRYEQEGARKRLRELRIMEEKLAGVPARMFFRVNFERLAELLSRLPGRKTKIPANQLAANQPTSWGKNHQLVGLSLIHI